MKTKKKEKERESREVIDDDEEEKEERVFETGIDNYSIMHKKAMDDA